MSEVSRMPLSITYCDTVVIKQPDAFEYCTIRLSELACYKGEYCCQAEGKGLRGNPKTGSGTKRSSASETDTWGLRDWTLIVEL